MTCKCGHTMTQALGVTTLHVCGRCALAYDSADGCWFGCDCGYCMKHPIGYRVGAMLQETGYAARGASMPAGFWFAVQPPTGPEYTI